MDFKIWNNFFIKRQPGIYTLGISASKFVEINKPKPANSIQKYFTAASKNEDDTTENNSENEEEESSENSTTYDSHSTKDSVAQEPSTSSSSSIKNDVRLLLLKQGSKKAKAANIEDDSENDADNICELDHDSNSNDSNRDSLRESKKVATEAKQDIKQLLLNQKSKKSRHFDDDNYDVEIIEIEKACENSNDKKDDAQTSKQKTSSSSLGSVENNESAASCSGQNFADVDYVVCDQCKKKILCWEMPEHEDFHYAQQISRQFTTLAAATSDQSEANNRKRSTAEETPNRLKSQKDTKNSKKPKTNSEANKPVVRPIDNYFKKKP